MLIVNRLLLIALNEWVNRGMSERKIVSPLYLVVFRKAAGDLGCIGRWAVLWMVNYKGFGKKRYWPNQVSIQAFSFIGEEDHQILS